MNISINLLKKPYDVQFFNCNIIYHEGERIRSQEVCFSPIYHVIRLYCSSSYMKFNASCLTLRVPHNVGFIVNIILSSPTCEHIRFILLPCLHFSCPCHCLEYAPFSLYLSKFFSIQFKSFLTKLSRTKSSLF